MNYIVDSHSHIQFPAYDENRAEVIKRARTAGVKMLAIGTQISTSQDGIKVADEYPEDVLGTTAGFHPSHVSANEYFDADELRADTKEEFDADVLREVAKNSRVLAIGECGLDYYRLVTSDTEQATRVKTRQKEVFLEQIELAKELNKPLVIHCRNAFSDLIEILTANHYSLTTIPGVIHFFSGTKDEARLLMELGFYIAFGGVVTFAKEYTEIVKFVPLDKIVLETDAPYVAPTPYRGKRNEPAYIINTAQRIAEIKGIDFEVVSDGTLKNTKTLFGL